MNMNITGLRKAITINSEQTAKKLDKKQSLISNNISYESNKENDDELSGLQLNKPIEIKTIKQSTDNIICNTRPESLFENSLLKHQRKIAFSNTTNELYNLSSKHQTFNEEACNLFMSSKITEQKLSRKVNVSESSTSDNQFKLVLNKKSTEKEFPVNRINKNMVYSTTSSVKHKIEHSPQLSISYRQNLSPYRPLYNHCNNSQLPYQKSESSIIFMKDYEKSPRICLPAQNKSHRIDRSMIHNVLDSCENFSKAINKCSQINDKHLVRGRHQTEFKHSFTKTSTAFKVNCTLPKNLPDETQVDKKILPLKKRKLTSDELGKYENWKLQDNNISYPPIQMISIAELEDMKQAYSVYQFKKPVELTAVPRLLPD